MHNISIQGALSMHRTTIMLPPELKARSVRLARKRGISLGELIREALERLVQSPSESVEEDPLFTDDEVYTGRVPEDLSQRHDDFLMGE